MSIFRFRRSIGRADVFEAMRFVLIGASSGVVYFGTFLGMNGSGDRAYNVGTWDGTEHGYATYKHEGTMNGQVLTWKG